MALTYHGDEFSSESEPGVPKYRHFFFAQMVLLTFDAQTGTVDDSRDIPIIFRSHCGDRLCFQRLAVVC